MANELDRLRGEVGEIVERGQGARGFGPDEARAWTERGPVAFGTERLSSSYWSRQVDILNAAWRNPRVAVRSANSMGKNFVTADYIVFHVFAKGGSVIYMAPTDRQLDIGIKELRRALRGSGLDYEFFHRSLRVGGETRVLFMTSNSADSLRGYHDDEGGLLVVIDEGQGKSVEAVAYDAAFSCATGEGDKILVLGNPAHTGGRFHAISKADNWCSLKIAASEHPNIAEGKVVIAGGPAPDWPEQIAAEYGRESPFYVAFVEGEFPTEGSLDSVFDASTFEPAHIRGEEQGGLRPTDQAPVVGVDVARSFAGDESVAAVSQEARLHRLVSWRSRDLVDTADRAIRVAKEAWHEWQVESHGLSLVNSGSLTSPRVPLIIDAPGVGSGVVDECRRRRRPVSEYWGWRPSSDPTRLANMRAEVHWNLRRLLENDQAQLPRDPMLREEMLATEFTLDAKGRITIASKDLIRASLGRSPDRLDAALIALHASSNTGRGWKQFHPIY